MIDVAVMGLMVAALSTVAGRMAGFRVEFWPINDLAFAALMLMTLLAVVPTGLVETRLTRNGASVGQRLMGLQILRSRDAARLTLSQASARWVLLYVPLALVVGFPLLSGAVYDPGFLLILITTPWAPYVAAPALAWYAVLALSMLVWRRPLHDCIVGSIVVRAERIDGR
jgi:hypothetical protein